MSFTQNLCPVCKGAKTTTAFVCGPKAGGVRELDCSTCKGLGFLFDSELDEYNDREAKHQLRRAVRLELDLSMREMAKKLGVPVLTYNDYEHGRIDMLPITTEQT